jgi:penicillin-binding protein 2
VKKGMGDLVTSGSVARYFRDCVVTAGAKTGSVQVGTAQANGTFVAFAPFEDPEIAVAVVVEKGESGSAMAALVVPIINAYFSASQAEGVTGEGTLLP